MAEGGFARLAAVQATSDLGTVVYAPVPAPANSKHDPHRPGAHDAPAIAEWRMRRGTEQAKSVYRQRAATAECVNAIARNRGLQRFLVRGLRKVKATALWFALAHNLMRSPALAPR